MKLLSPALSKLARFRLAGIEAWTNDPIAAQREVLQSLVTAGRLTVRGERTEAGFKIWYSVPAPKPSTSIKLTYFPEANQIEWA